MQWNPTHRITFTPSSGGSAQEWTVMLCKDPYSQDFYVGLTEEEWQRHKVPTWRLRKSDNSWLWNGMPGPDWRQGAVRVTTLEVEIQQQPSTLRFSRPRR